MVLSDLQMLEMMKEGKIVIEPFNDDQLSTSSYDMRLGTHYCKLHKPEETHLDIFNPYNKSHVDLVWGSPIKARSALEVFQEEAYQIDDWYQEGIFPTDLIILVPPGETILAHTEEFIGGVRYHTSMMKARSSWGRSLFEVCKCAGWGDIGYFNRWTMEITNNSQDYPIPMVVGDRVAQLAFLESGPIRDNPYGLSGKYQVGDKLQEIMDGWDPNSIKPQLWRDKDIERRRLRYERVLKEVGESVNA